VQDIQTRGTRPENGQYADRKPERRMQTIAIRPSLTMAYEDHWFGDPWTTPETVVMVHGNAESSRAWAGWVPRLAAKYRVVRPDMPGFGASSEPVGYRWTAAELAADLRRFLDKLGIAQCHLVGPKYAPPPSIHFPHPTTKHLPP